MCDVCECECDCESVFYFFRFYCKSLLASLDVWHAVPCESLKTLETAAQGATVSHSCQL